MLPRAPIFVSKFHWLYTGPCIPRVKEVHFYDSTMDGYARLARDMGNYRELGIIRGFKKFNLQNLLYLQAELNKLEFEHKELVEQNSASTRSTVDRDWDILIDPPNDSDKKQWQKFLEIRGKLKEYSMIHDLVLLNET